MLSHLGVILEQLGDTMGPKSDKISQDSGQERQHEPTQRENAAQKAGSRLVPEDLKSARWAAERAGEDLGGVTENYNTETLDNLPTSLTRSWAPTGPVRIM